ncbi:MAG: response regulator [Phycisphaera sp. TMED24]|nr:MAG: response regulator [Phycisphaera sp. TMED24]
MSGHQAKPPLRITEAERLPDVVRQFLLKHFEVITESRPHLDQSAPFTQWDLGPERIALTRLREVHEFSAGILELDEPGHEGDTIAGRLKILDRRIHSAIESLFQWDSWEVRLLHPETKQLELFVSHNLAPLRIGESIFAAARGNGITGRVAATGQCVLTRQADSDDEYLPGLEGAQSTMTLPLQLGTRILGTLNVESHERAAFSEADLSEALLLGRYVAAALHFIELVLRERSAVDRQTASAFRGALAHPLEKLEAVGEMHPEVKAIATEIREAMDAAGTGPKAVLATERDLRPAQPDPDLQGRHILVADNEAVVVQGLTKLLKANGVTVTACDGGAEAITAFEECHARGQCPDLVITDIRMPDRNGYEVFRGVRDLEPQLPVVLMTGFGYDPSHSILRATEEGMHAVLFKPIPVPRLFEVLKSAFNA